jgi:hypothetical protein
MILRIDIILLIRHFLALTIRLDFRSVSIKYKNGPPIGFLEFFNIYYVCSSHVAMVVGVS